MRNRIDVEIEEWYRQELIPELFDKYKSREISAKEARLLTMVSQEDQRTLAAKLAVVKEVPTPDEEYEKKIVDLKKSHEEKVGELQSRIKTLAADLSKETRARTDLEKEKETLAQAKKKVEESLNELEKTQEEQKEKLETAMKTYEADKEKLTKEAAKHVEADIAELKDAIKKNADTIRERQKELSQRDEQIRGLRVNISKLEAKINIARQAVNAHKDDYETLLNKYANPGIVKAHLVAMQQTAETLVKWAKQNKVTQTTFGRAEAEIGKLILVMKTVVKEMKTNVSELSDVTEVDALIDAEMEDVERTLDQKRIETELVIKDIAKSSDEASLQAVMEAFEKKRRELQEEAAADADEKGKAAGATVINLR